ncbi:glycoside hydrolase family 3 C-terminal domain-containing protein [Xanthomonas arboricola]|uniref:glycoside hydrolase family 3 C-terminal domain-containing protein n=1 Tax=Xanthomonas arboricola TaxID=56448 RepID=UPI001EE9A818|nr:glycoside hydrolase family 3 C-terminal domain-containing protein [Xanthomonas arboricola]
MGSEAGNAIADIVFGVQAPSGRLPVSFPHAAGQVPYTYAHPPSGRPNLDPHGCSGTPRMTATCPTRRCSRLAMARPTGASPAPICS